MKETEEQGPKTEPETVPDVEPEKPAPKGLGIGMAGWLSLLGLVVQNASLVMTTRYATGMRTGEAFIPAAAVVCSEVVKLFLSIILVQFTDTRGAIRAIHSELSSHFSSCFQCFVPAACYTLASSFIYYALANMEVTLFQVCTQSKVLITAGWSIVLLERKFSSSKWIALFALAIGISLCSYQGATSKKSDDSKREQRILFGLFSVFISSMSASFGGVYFEKLLKKDPRSKDVSLWMRNVFLSMFSLLFGTGGFVLSEGLEVNFFRGFDTFTWIIILLQALGGIFVAMCVKYADSVIKGFATAFSILACALMSYLLFSFQPSLIFGLGVTCVVAATLLYSR
eukprot:TRINITY_DN7495_c0_g1_i2.p1 TRINITY_DN7495_c0_g1~~TRINITY_DN7495_c0_g1_i2.p1  ORF type:complete len:341 (+),score=36.14 TRINITY_DN7495_c0_g1_i2:82-1104(+)